MMKKGLIAGFINLIAGLALSSAYQAIFPFLTREYQNPGLMRPWSDPLMMIFFAYPFIFAFVAYYLWGLLQKNFSGTPEKKAFQFAKIYFIIATIPGMFISYTTFPVSLLMIATWTFTGFIQAYIAGYIFARAK